MYIYVSAMATKLTGDAKYYPVDITTLTMYSIFATYRYIEATLIEPVTEKEVVLKLNDLPTSVKNLQTTFSQWLINNGNNSLPTSDPVQYTYEHVTAKQAIASGFTTRIHNVNYNINIPLTSDLEKDLLLSKENVDYDAMENYALTTVNGLVYKSAKFGNYLSVLDCIKDVKKSNRHSVGYLDFQKLGALSYHSIEAEDISGSTNKFRDKVYITVPNEVLTKPTFLVLGGFIIPFRNRLRPVTDNTLRFDFSKWNWASRFYLLEDLVDTTYLNVNKLYNGGIATAELFSDEVITNLLTGPQSFFVSIDTSDEVLFGYDTTVDRTTVPGIFSTPSKPVLPLICEDGRIFEYTWRKDGNGYSLHCPSTLKPNWIFETTDYKKQGVISKVRDSAKPYSLSNGYFLSIASRKVIEE